ncbi:YdjY domain-containing protein [Sulfuriroseicoccus oceanibius]|uniref:Uncharacterized protein n=1 Tax=Sulfuriroseicoccus oceanibius TaxID=2707525 RepID=A0A6B3LDC9_9BACT|nr:YdjY domain-containing protein [Sulfuriroseicoccus oceanibius]QQL45167.1 hypothetical protein G3M56_000845 [Sulfuriroseicoccus oceanibius]
MKRFLSPVVATVVGVCAVVGTFSIHAQSQAQPSSDKGRVDSSGKFTPRGGHEGPGGGPTITREQMAEEIKSGLEIKKVSKHVYRLGKVTFDKKARTVTVPMTVNMDRGIVEYLLVAESGKVHESVFTTKARPRDVHLACILLGMKGFEGTKWPVDETAIPSEFGVRAKVTWATNGPDREMPLSDCVVKADTSLGPQSAGKPLADGAWFYTGSNFYGGGFAAEKEGSIVAVIGDSAALINGIRRGRDQDEMHAANQEALPKKGRNVQLVLELPKK